MSAKGKRIRALERRVAELEFWSAKVHPSTVIEPLTHHNCGPVCTVAENQARYGDELPVPILPNSPFGV